MSKPFVHLHVHTEFSLLDGVARINKLVKVAKEYNMPAVAMTDHGNMYGATRFYKECKSQGVKGILGCEFYVDKDLTVKSGKTKFTHLVILVKNEIGYKNICKLCSVSFVDGFYYKPRIDLKLLEQYSEGLICLSGCMAGEIPQLILQRRYDEAEELVLWFKNLFKDDFYLELQNHGLEEDVIINTKLREFAQKHNIKKVATNDVHYIYKDDAELQDVLMCVQMGKTVDDPDRFKMDNAELYFKTYDEMALLFPNDLDALDNTVEIAEKCNYNFEFGKYLFPKFVPDDGSDPVTYIRKLINQGIEKKYGKETQEIRDRIESELQVIEVQGFIEYFLIVWDYINKAKEMNIAVGPGRGSGAGSIVAYLLDITNIDPLKYDLIFERFLHTERVSAPDFDVDFAADRRAEVIEYVKQKYTDPRVIKIVTFGTMAARAAIKDVARVLRMPYNEVNRITKAIPNNYKKQVIKKSFGMYTPKPGDKDYGTEYGVPELIEMYQGNIDVQKVIDIAIKCEDAPRQLGTHACGVVIGADALEKFMPLSRNGDDITTQFEAGDIEKLGHLKMDFLGLKNLNDIHKAIDYIKENHGVSINFDEMECDNPEVYKLISTGNTKAIFQIESQGFQKFMKELKPTCLEDIIAGVSLYRPGPMDSIPQYVHNKHNPHDVKFLHPILEPILNVTYGCIVYQEQVMRICQDMAGFTLGQADMIRRAMGKKNLEEMLSLKGAFLSGREQSVDGYGKVQPAIDGAVARGVPIEAAEAIWKQMETFAEYAFNKSHAAAYSMLTYQTAYLKTFYKPEFMTSVINNRITNADEISNYVTYCKEEKIDVLPPDINKSQTMFSVKNNQIRFGLAGLKGVGINVIDRIIEERNANGDFTGLVDFVNRFEAGVLNKRVLEGLILSGAFDCFKIYRSQLMQVYATLLDRASADRKMKVSGQTSLFENVLKNDEVNSISYPDIPEFVEQEKLKLEKEVVGVYISGHPLLNYANKFREFNLTSDMIKTFEEDVVEYINEDGELVTQAGADSSLVDGMEVICGGLLCELKKLLTKRDNQEMAFGKLEDLYGGIELMFFPQSFVRFKDKLNLDAMMTIYGKLSIRDGESPIILVNKVELWDLDKQQKVEKQKVLYLKYDVSNIELHDKIFKTLASYPGRTEVIAVDLQNKSFKLKVLVNPNNFLQNELNAYLSSEFIKLV